MNCQPTALMQTSTQRYPELLGLALVWALVWARANHLGHRLLNVKILNLIPLLCGLVLNVNAVAASLEWAYVALLLLTRG